jgi:NADPH-dependent F420 reductase
MEPDGETMEESLILTIAILGGTGNEGPGLALRWAHAGYPIIIGSRVEERAKTTAAELNGIVGGDTIMGMQNADAARNADICVLTVKHSAHQPALESLKAALQGKILVDTTARVDFRDPVPPGPPSAARTAQEILGPDVRVVAAFQNIPAHALKEDLDERLTADVFVFADDERAAEEVVKLAEGGGMGAYFAGDLDHALVAEGLTALLIALNKRYRSKLGAIRVTGIEP